MNLHIKKPDAIISLGLCNENSYSNINKPKKKLLERFVSKLKNYDVVWDIGPGYTPYSSFFIEELSIEKNLSGIKIFAIDPTLEYPELKGNICYIKEKYEVIAAHLGLFATDSTFKNLQTMGKDKIEIEKLVELAINSDARVLLVKPCTHSKNEELTIKELKLMLGKKDYTADESLEFIFALKNPLRPYKGIPNPGLHNDEFRYLISRGLFDPCPI